MFCPQTRIYQATTRFKMKKGLMFDNNKVKHVSDYLQAYMQAMNIDKMTADECAKLLHENNILSSEGHPKPGFNFRQLLRDGRDKKIEMIQGASQISPRKRWQINRVVSSKNTIEEIVR